MYYIMGFLNAVLFEIMGVGILWWFGTGWISYITALVCVVISQVHITSCYRDTSLQFI